MKTLLCAVAMAFLTQSVQAQVKTQPAPVPGGQPKVIQPQPIQPGGLPPGGFGGGMGINPFGMMNSPLMLVANADVQKDLKAKPEQVKKFNELADQFKKNQLAAMQGAMDKDSMKKLQDLNESTKKSLGEILTAEQSKRLTQLELQAKGPMALFDGKISADLGVTKDQRTQVMKVYQNGMTKMSEMYKDMKFDPQTMQKQMADMQKKSADLNRSITADMIKTLTTEQQTKWKGMVGEPFKGELPQGGAMGMGNPMMMPGMGNPFGPGGTVVPPAPGAGNPFGPGNTPVPPAPGGGVRPPNGKSNPVPVNPGN
jgi:hypothetical protein